MKTEPAATTEENPISLPKPSPMLGAAKADEPLVWDTRFVQRLVSKAGEKASVLVVGQREADALVNHLQASFPGDVVSLKNLRYAGLRVVIVGDESCIRVETARSIYESSRHALLRKHEERPRGEVSKSLERKRLPFI